MNKALLVMALVVVAVVFTASWPVIQRSRSRRQHYMGMEPDIYMG